MPTDGRNASEVSPDKPVRGGGCQTRSTRTRQGNLNHALREALPATTRRRPVALRIQDRNLLSPIFKVSPLVLEASSQWDEGFLWG